MVQPKCTKMNYQDIPSIGRNGLEFFCVPLYTEFLFDLYKMFQIASVYDKNTKLENSAVINS